MACHLFSLIRAARSGEEARSNSAWYCEFSRLARFTEYYSRLRSHAHAAQKTDPVGEEGRHRQSGPFCESRLRPSRVMTRACASLRPFDPICNTTSFSCETAKMYVDGFDSRWTRFGFLRPLLAKALANTPMRCQALEPGELASPYGGEIRARATLCRQGGGSSWTPLTGL